MASLPHTPQTPIAKRFAKVPTKLVQPISLPSLFKPVIKKLNELLNTFNTIVGGAGSDREEELALCQREYNRALNAHCRLLDDLGCQEHITTALEQLLDVAQYQAGLTPLASPASSGASPVLGGLELGDGGASASLSPAVCLSHPRPAPHTSVEPTPSTTDLCLPVGGRLPSSKEVLDSLWNLGPPTR
ncbi:MAG: hypothetical protein FRX48_05213 [Lasallia pustulata]|uniref:Uncharacterized protein n=1 Tax=Lasallia pustulata TaxID=136370 RepID=A0A5M8PN71_9LECA|nr:MAG: hypothetical protein FRX48_05213 [Lasallia pustulata]